MAGKCKNAIVLNVWKDDEELLKIWDSDTKTARTNILEKVHLAVAQRPKIEKLLQKVPNFYEKMMEELTKQKVFSDENLAIIHGIVLEEICSFKIFQSVDYAQQNIHEALSSSFKKFEKENTFRADFTKAKAESFVQKQLKSYNAKMIEFLPRRGPSKNDLELAKMHMATSVNATKILRMEISNLGVDIDESPYISELQEYIADDWIEIQKQNLKQKLKELDDEIKLKERGGASRETNEKENKQQEDEKNEALKNAKTKLKSLIETIQHRIVEIQNPTERIILYMGSDSAAALLANSNTTQEMVDNKIAELEECVNQYLPKQ